MDGGAPILMVVHLHYITIGFGKQCRAHSITSWLIHLTEFRTPIGECEITNILILSVSETQDGYANHEVGDKNSLYK